MKKNILIISIIMVISCFGEDAVTRIIRTSDQMIKVGDYEKAENSLRTALASDPENSEVMWRLGKALNHKAQALSGMDRHDTFEESSSLLSQAIKIDWKNPNVHIELARTLGYMGLFKADWDNLTLAARIQEELDFAIKRDSTIADAWFLYGMWHRFVSQRSLLIRKPYGLGEACQEKAIESFEKAIEMDDENALYPLELAIYYKFLEDKENSRKYLVKTTKMKKNLYTKRYIEQATNLLNQLDESGQ